MSSVELLSPDVMSRLRAALEDAGFRYDAVADLLGPAAHAALSRNETTPGLRATGDGSALATLTRLWPLQAAVPETDVERALPGIAGALVATGFLARSGAEVRSLVDLRPYADDSHDWWVVSDLTPGLDGAPARIDPDHVLGISSASSSLAQLTVREPVGRALDLGTGCGVQALHLAEHAGEVVVTDVNPRGLAMARLNAMLNGVTLDVREGSLFEPVADEQFDLVVTNPPSHLAPGGWCQVLANWVHRRGVPWRERIAGWLEGAGSDAWVVQREVADPASYVELWLKDAGLHRAPDYPARYDAWLAWFEEQDVEGVGFGWVNLRRTAGGADGEMRLEEWPHEVEQPVGASVSAPTCGSSLRRARGRGPGDDRAAPATGDVPGAPRGHGRRRPGGRL